MSGFINQDGSSGVFNPPPKFYDVLLGASYDDQNPVGLDIPMLVDFGDEIDTDQVKLEADGTVLFKQDGQYRVSFRLQVGRAGSSQVSAIYGYASFKPLIGPASIIDSALVEIDDFKSIFLVLSISIRDYNAGDSVEIYIARSSTGNDSGGLMTEPPSASLIAQGLTTPPSARLLIQQFR